MRRIQKGSRKYRDALKASEDPHRGDCRKDDERRDKKRSDKIHGKNNNYRDHDREEKIVSSRLRPCRHGEIFVKSNGEYLVVEKNEYGEDSNRECGAQVDFFYPKRQNRGGTEKRRANVT